MPQTVIDWFDPKENEPEDYSYVLIVQPDEEEKVVTCVYMEGTRYDDEGNRVKSGVYRSIRQSSSEYYDYRNPPKYWAYFPSAPVESCDGGRSDLLMGRG